jgi:thioredoxin-related protein
MGMKKMIKIGVLLFVPIAVFLLAFGRGKEVLPIGSVAPATDIKMQNIDGKFYSLSDFKADKGLLVIFSCNTCPFVLGSGEKEGCEKRYNRLNAYAMNVPVGMVLINSNEAKRPNGGDALEDMQKQAREKGYEMPYLLDMNHMLADAFGARTTPHVFLFDEQMKLIYEGAIDDNVNSAAEVKTHYVLNAFDEMVQGKPMSTTNTNAVGCSIKRKS